MACGGVSRVGSGTAREVKQFLAHRSKLRTTSRQTLDSGCGIGDASQGVGLVGLDADDDPLFQQHLYPNQKPDHNRHAHRVGLPVGPVDARQFGAVRDDLGRAGNRGTVFGAHITSDARIPARALHLVRISRSEKFDLPGIHSQPHLDFLQFAGSFVGAEPLGVSFEGALQFWGHKRRFKSLGESPM